MRSLRRLFPQKTAPGAADKQAPATTGVQKSEPRPQDAMKGVNSYWKELNRAEIEKGAHRDLVGGMWDEIGKLQYDFMLQQGLKPGHTFLDVGCGSMRGGVYFVRYLDTGKYLGLDVNASLIEAGKRELEAIQCMDKQPQLLVDDKFEFTKFGVQVDYALALSVFTHLFLNHIGRCLVEMKKVLKPEGVFYATFFQAPHPVHVEDLQHHPGEIITHWDADPFHYSLEEIQGFARQAGLKAELVEAWQHPRAQKMLRIRHE